MDSTGNKIEAIRNNIGARSWWGQGLVVRPDGLADKKTGADTAGKGNVIVYAQPPRGGNSVLTTVPNRWWVQ
jgi:hypothetical protein